MPFYKGLPADAKLLFVGTDGPEYEYNGETIREFNLRRWIDGKVKQLHSDLWYTQDSEIHIYSDFTAICPWNKCKSKDNEIIPEELVACLKRIKERIHNDPDIHVGWLPRNTSLIFIYKDKIYDIGSDTLEFDKVVYSESEDFDYRLCDESGVFNVGDDDDQTEWFVRKTLHEELGIEFFHNSGVID